MTARNKGRTNDDGSGGHATPGPWPWVRRAAAIVLGLCVCALGIQVGVGWLQAAAAGPSNATAGLVVGVTVLAASVVGLVLVVVRRGRRVQRVAAWVVVTAAVLVSVLLIPPI